MDAEYGEVEEPEPCGYRSSAGLYDKYGGWAHSPVGCDEPTEPGSAYCYEHRG